MNFKIKKKVIILLQIIFIIVIFFFCRLYIDNFCFTVTEYNISINSGDNAKYSTIKDKVFVQISDLHNQSYGKNNIDLLTAIEKINPDYILFTGDMVSTEHTTFEGFYDLIDALYSKYTCFYVVGNHELGLGKGLLSEIYKYLKEHNVYVLDNEFVCVDNINFYGLNYDDRYYKNTKYNLEQMNKDLR